MIKTIKCQNPECKAENPVYAKFCRKCGEPLNKERFVVIKYKLRKMWEHLLHPEEWSRPVRKEAEVFTPNLFPNIKFSPCSIVEIDFKCMRGFICIVTFIIMLVLYTFNEREVRDFFRDYFDLRISDWIPITLGVLIVIVFIPFIIHCYKSLKYRCNADYIETNPFAQNICRIAKKQKLGLFDKKKNTTILRTKYDDITLFDDGHFLVVRKGKRGLYSIRKNKFIVPARYDEIDSFVNSIAKCSLKGQFYYYDVNGHRMK